MCFSTKKLQSLTIKGNIFDTSKLTCPLTIHDYISILIDNDKYLDSELINIINSSGYNRLNDTDSLGKRKTKI
jgi:hypothetical protein